MPEGVRTARGGDGRLHDARREQHRVLPAALWVAVLVISTATPSYGLGVIVSSNSDSVIKGSRTIIAPMASGNTFQMTEIDFERPAGSPKFIWILPVPAEGTEVVAQKCSDDRFSDLAKLAQPRILLRQRVESESCGEAKIPDPVESDINAHGYSSNDETRDPLTHTAFASIEDMQGWLQELDPSYVLSPSNKAVLSHYVVSIYQFLAVEVPASLTTGKICLQFEYSPPSDRTYDHIVPLKTGSVSTGEDTDPINTEILVYALDDGTVRPLTWQDGGGAIYRAVTINLAKITPAGESSNYDAVFEEAVGDPPGFVIEYSGQLEAPLEWTGSDRLWLTRLRSRMTPSELTGPDLALQVDEPEDVPRDYSIIVADASRRPDLTIALCAFALVATLAIRRRKRSA